MLDYFLSFFYSFIFIGISSVFSISLSKFDNDITTVWFANAILVFFLLRSTQKNFYFWLIGGSFGVLASNLFYFQHTIYNSLVFTIGNTLESLIVYFLIKKYIRYVREEFDITKLLSIFILSSCLTGIFAASLLEIPNRNFNILLFQWIAAKVTGMLILMPLILLSTRKNIKSILNFKDIFYTFFISIILIFMTFYALNYLNIPLIIIIAALTIGIIYSKPYSAAIMATVTLVAMIIIIKFISMMNLSGVYQNIPVQNLFFGIEAEGYEKYLLPFIISLISFVLIIQKNILYQRHQFLSYAADKDWLTGLFNRRYFEEQIKKILQSYQKNLKKKHILIMLDLDRFKIINDTVGHIAGDKLLKEIAKIISSSVRSTDVVARLGGDEFAIIMFDCNMHDAIMVIKEIFEKIKNYKFIYNKREFTLSTSAGLANITPDITSVKEIIERADLACYESKHKGRNNYTIYNENSHIFLKKQTEIEIVNAIKKSLENNLFVFYAHRITAINPEKEDYYEILLKMPMSDGTLLSAGEFLELAQRYNLIIDIDKWVFENLFKNYNKFILPKYRYSINVSAISLSNEDFVEFLYTLMKNPNVDMSRVQFEITESTSITNSDLVKQFIAVVKAAGGSVVLDDFGMGYSSFHYVNDFDVHSIKVDGSFIQDIDNPTNNKIIKSIVDLSHDLNISTVAEYVDTEHRFEQVKKLNFDYAQGFWKYKPIPLNDLVEQLKKENTA